MKAALCKTLDGPDALIVDEVAPATAGPGEVVVRVRAAGLNFFDTLITRGKYQYKPALPFSPAGEMAGEITGLGAGVTGFKVGDRVCGYLGWGCAREELAARAELLIKMPDGVGYETAAGINVTYGTAIHGLKDRGRLRAGETVAVLGASGGAGLAAVEVAKELGARVIAVASSTEKLAICRAHGADELVNYTDADLKQVLRDLTGGKGVDVVYDCVGGPFAEPALRSTAWEGRYLVIGFAAGEIPKLPANLLLLRGCDAVGVFWGEAVTRDPARHVAGMSEVLSWIAAGRLRPHIHAKVPLAGIGAAIGQLDKRAVAGKLIVTL
jgi:NADPH2:quinone reductase